MFADEELLFAALQEYARFYHSPAAVQHREQLLQEELKRNPKRNIDTIEYFDSIRDNQCNDEVRKRLQFSSEEVHVDKDIFIHKGHKFQIY